MTTVVEIPLNPVGSQQVSASLNGQQITLNVYDHGGSIYVDFFSSGVAVLYGVLALNQVLMIRNSYFGVIGDFYFWDTEGVPGSLNPPIDPVYSGLGARFQLLYEGP